MSDRAMELLERIDDLLADAVSAYWVDDSPLEKIAEARTLIAELVGEQEPGS